MSEIKDVVVTYIRSAVAGLDLPEISGCASRQSSVHFASPLHAVATESSERHDCIYRSKDWGAYEITGLAIESVDIRTENVQIAVDQAVNIKLLSIQSVFKAFQVREPGKKLCNPRHTIAAIVSEGTRSRSAVRAPRDASSDTKNGRLCIYACSHDALPRSGRLRKTPSRV